ncbi:hypothetical protein [Paenibacillus sp. FSL L8-0708]|uniref:hypothetical protein n=1 Tax=Paenibacillus sp. FSL L8-0708 TaxID=2975311 RepID=UPI0030FA520E
MKLVETRNIGTDYDKHYGKGSIDVSLRDDNGRHVTGVAIYAGEPEDAVFFRDLSGAKSIANLVKTAYEAGKRGETLEYEMVLESEADE